MIRDAAGIDGDEALRTDVCIVGGGAAGITLACELDASGLGVVLLEAGGPASLWSRSSGAEWFHGHADEPHPPPSQFRRTSLGGTTAVWGGRCVPYDPIDFERRDYVPESGWPIGYESVAVHYPKAMQYCDAGDADFSAASCLNDRRPILPGVSDPSLELDKIERYSLPTHFGKKFHRRLDASANVRVICRARVVRLVASDGGAGIAAVEFAAPDGRLLQVRAARFVLAAGGLETTRLLLASDASGVGFGNRSGHLGRHYMCHVAGVAGVVRTRRGGAVFHFEKTRDGVYAKRKMHLSADAQRQARVLNIAFRLHYPSMSDPAHGSSVLSAMYMVKQMLAPEFRHILQHGKAGGLDRFRMGDHLRNLAGGVVSLGKFGVDWTSRRILARRKLPYVLVANADGSFPLDFNSEQLPLHENRVSLSEERDAYGMPRIRIRWRKSEQDVKSICTAFETLRRGLQSGNACSLEFDPDRLRETVEVAGPAGGHHLGTARMASTSDRGVVDGDCALFDFPNLHVASSAVFPTASHANPTLTIVAMAIRLADHLKAPLR